MTDSNPVCSHCQRPAHYYTREERQGNYHRKAIVTVFYCAACRPLDAVPMPADCETPH